MIIEIEPLDTLFFRDGRPFTMGEDTWSNSIFPPYPSVIYGALRTVYFANHPDEISKANKNGDPTKNLKIKGIYYLVENKIYLPLPFDCVKEKEEDKDKKEIKVRTLSLTKNYGLSMLPTENILLSRPEKKLLSRPEKKVENVPYGVISLPEFKKYLFNPEQEFTVKKITDNLISEPKIGIALSRETRTSEESKLYRVDMKRLKDIKLLVEFEGLDIQDEGIMKLGGEGKGARYKKYKGEDTNISFPTFGENEKVFKIVLTTPAIFKNGWLPDKMNDKSLEWKINGLRLKLLTAAIGKPIYIGGFDIKARKPKPTYKAVPAGSVYYFELKEGTMEDVKKVFHQKAISDVDNVYKEQGFGITYVGKV